MKAGKRINRCVSVAPMMKCTDRHFRYLARLISQNTLLYTEMVTTAAIIHGDRDKLLGCNSEEHPLALQLGGSDPQALATCAKIAVDYGYDEVNLNVGCPSDRVQSGQFGACLLKKPDLVARCVQAMREAVSIPVTVKTRIGVDEQDSYQALSGFVQKIIDSGCASLAVHARKAWLQGLSPRENRNVPPLRYDMVYQLKHDFPQLEITINGGIKTIEDIRGHLQHLDGVMLGREAYSNPWVLANIEAELFAQQPNPSMTGVVMAYLQYVSRQLLAGYKLRAMTRHLVGLFQGQPGARLWRRYLSEQGGNEALGASVIETALQFVETN